MKKPKIKVNEFIIDDDEVRIEGGSISINDKELFEDEIAELIKEMIDTLIKVREAYQGVGGFEGTGQNLMKLIPEIDKALKKAGCSDD